MYTTRGTIMALEVLQEIETREKAEFWRGLPLLTRISLLFPRVSRKRIYNYFCGA
jgi:hypothetical protein